MKLVVDTNVILGALIRNSTTRSLILNPNHEFFTPEFALDEVERNYHVLSVKSGLPLEEIRLLYDILKLKLEIVPVEDVLDSYEKAENALAKVDEKDVPFLAAALSIDCDGIWSNDAHLKKQRLVKVWNTLELVRELRMG